MEATASALANRSMKICVSRFRIVPAASFLISSSTCTNCVGVAETISWLVEASASKRGGCSAGTLAGPPRCGCCWYSRFRAWATSAAFESPSRYVRTWTRLAPSTGSTSIVLTSWAMSLWSSSAAEMRRLFVWSEAAMTTGTAGGIPGRLGRAACPL